MPIEFVRYNVTFELLEPLLGTIAKDPAVYEAYQRSQQSGEDEQVVVNEDGDEVKEEKKPDTTGWTTFYTDDEGRPVMFDYQVKGFLKEAGNTLKKQVEVANLRHHIDNDVFIYPRRMVLAEKVDDVLERPLRAMTAQGPRVTVVRSDVINPPRNWTWELKVLKGSKVTHSVLETCCEYGELKGLGQWRNGGYGRVSASLEKLS